MTKAIRRPLVVSGAGERPVKSSLTSPVCALPECSPLWRAFAHLAYKYSKKCTQSPALSELVRVRVQSCVYRFSWLGSSRACVPCGDRTIVLRLQRRFGRSVCQPFSLEAFPVKTRNFVRWGHPHTLDEISTLINLCF